MSINLPDSAFGVSLTPLLQATKEAGAKILEIYATDFDIEIKGDDSPLTAADKAANKVLMEYIEKYTPEIPVVSEENKEVAYAERKDWKRFWLVDPLDGTKEFIKKNGEFTVNIALIEDGKPILGVVYQPVVNTLYLGVVGEGCYKVTDAGEVVAISGGKHYSELDEITVVASRSHLTQQVEDFVEELKANGKSVSFRSAGSSLKLCLVAEGEADFYPRFGPTMEWDTGAAHAVAIAAGRKVLNHETGLDLSYNKENLLNPFFTVE